MNHYRFGNIDLPQLADQNNQVPPPNKRTLLERNLSSNELREWYSAKTPVERINWAIKKGIVYLDANYKFNKRNWIPRMLDEMPNSQRAMIHNRDKNCAYCGAEDDLQVDHLIPLMAWPEELVWLANTSSNLVSACRDCNIKKSYKYSDWSFKNPYPVTSGCHACSFAQHQVCGSVAVYCHRCKDISNAPMCVMHGVECSNESGI